MGDSAVRRIEDMETMASGAFKRARAELGVSSFGLQVIDLPPNFERYPEHDHSSDGQEEVYVVLRGGGQIEIDGQRHPLDPETLARVGPGVPRRLWPGEQGMRVLVVGGIPGQAYRPPPVTKLGAPDPGPRNLSSQMASPPE